MKIDGGPNETTLSCVRLDRRNVLAMGALCPLQALAQTARFYWKSLSRRDTGYRSSTNR